MNNILWLKEVSDENLKEVGNKAVSISKIFNNNIPVSNGFCVSSEVFESFLEKTNIKNKIEETLKGLESNNLSSIYNVSEKIQNLIMNTNLPDKLKAQIIESYENINVDIDVYKMAGKQTLEIIKAGRETTYVSVRTSPVNNNVNLQLNVKGKEELIKSIQKCWVSMFTPNSLKLKIKNKIPLNDSAVSVLVQRMIDAEKSGIVYTADLFSNKKNELVIEACFGQGEVITTGTIIPDRYFVNKDTLDIEEKSINKQDFMIIKDDNIGRNIKKNIFNGENQKLTSEEIKRVSLYALEIENLYKQAQEIEFCINKDKVYILETKPLIFSYTKENHEYTDEIEEELKKKEQIILVRGLNASLGIRHGYIKIVNSDNDIDDIKENQVIVIKTYNNININLLDTEKIKKLAGIVTDNDNINSPLAKIAKEFGIPCIVSTTDATKILKQDSFVIVDGNTGIVYQAKENGSKFWNKIADYYDTVTEVKVLIDNLEKIIPDSDKNDGVGLLKIYFDNFWLEKEKIIEELSKEIETRIGYFKNKPIWYYVNNFLNNPDLLKLEFEAIKKLHNKGLTNLGVAIPHIIDVLEIKKMKEMLKEINLEPLEEIEFGIIIDTPASSILIEELCKEQVDFVIIDLVKLTNAILDTSNEQQDRYNEFHPALVKQVSNIIKTCRKFNIETNIIGMKITEPEFIELLVKQGVDSIMCFVDCINETRNKISKSEKKIILKAVREEVKLQNIASNGDSSELKH